MHKAKGVALLLVLAIVAVASVLASSWLARQQQHIQRSASLAFTDQALRYALAAEGWAQVLLEDDFDPQTRIDSLAEPWATPLPYFNVEGGAMRASLSDAQASLNVNNLLAGGKLASVYQKRIDRLLQQQEADAGVLDALIDWLDADTETTGFGGAEDDYYSRLQPPYRAANQALGHISELRLLRGMQDTLYRGLLPALTALPESVPLNLNTAPREVLLTLGLNESQVEQALLERSSRAFQDVDDFVSRVNLLADDVDRTGLAVGSDFFWLEVSLLIGDQGYAQQTLLQRDSSGKVRVLQRRRVAESVM